jgi:hypothetical protein
MEDVLNLYAEPPDSKRPVVCLDETPTQLIGFWIKRTLALLIGQGLSLIVRINLFSPRDNNSGSGGTIG